MLAGLVVTRDRWQILLTDSSLPKLCCLYDANDESCRRCCRHASIDTRAILHDFPSDAPAADQARLAALVLHASCLPSCIGSPTTSATDFILRAPGLGHAMGDPARHRDDQVIVFYYLGHCHRSWYSVSFSDLVALFHAATLCPRWSSLAINGMMVSTLHPPRWRIRDRLGPDDPGAGRIAGRRPAVARGAGPAAVGQRLSQSVDRGGQPVGRNAGPAPARDRRLKYQPVGYLDTRRVAHRFDAGRHSRLGPAGRRRRGSPSGWAWKTCW